MASAKGAGCGQFASRRTAHCADRKVSHTGTGWGVAEGGRSGVKGYATGQR